MVLIVWKNGSVFEKKEFRGNCEAELGRGGRGIEGGRHNSPKIVSAIDAYGNKETGDGSTRTLKPRPYVLGGSGRKA